MAKTAKAKPTANTGTRTKKSTSSRTTAVRRKTNTNELHSAHQGSLLNPTDVDDPALSTVNPSLNEINYDILSPARATRSQAKKAIIK